MAKEKQFHHGNLKKTLVDVAVKLLDKEGPEGVTIRAVARAAGVSHGAPVNHYPDRSALLTAIAQKQFELIRSKIDTALSKIPDDSSDRIEVFANALMDFGLRYPHRYQLLWRSDLVDHTNADLLSVMDDVYDRLCAEITKAAPNTGFDKDTIAVALWSLVHGYVDMRRSGMFVPLKDSISGKPRRVAMLDLLLRCLE